MSAPMPTPSSSVPVVKSDQEAEEDSRYWSAAVASAQFSTLLATKIRCIAPLLATSFAFLVTLTLLAGYAKGFMGQKVVGAFNVGYLMILLTYLLCWAVSVIYVRAANRSFDAQSAQAITALTVRRPA